MISKGELSKAEIARKLGIQRKSLYDWMKKPHFQGYMKRLERGEEAAQPEEMTNRKLEAEVRRLGLQEALRRLRQDPKSLSSRDLSSIVVNASKTRKVKTENLETELAGTSLDAGRIRQRIEKDPGLKRKILGLVENHRGGDPAELQEAIEKIFWSGQTREEYLENFYRRLARNIQARRNRGERIRDGAAYLLSRGFTKEIGRIEPHLTLDEDKPWASLYDYLSQRLAPYLGGRSPQLNEREVLRMVAAEHHERQRRSHCMNQPLQREQETKEILE